MNRNNTGCNDKILLKFTYIRFKHEHQLQYEAQTADDTPLNTRLRVVERKLLLTLPSNRHAIISNGHLLAAGYNGYRVIIIIYIINFGVFSNSRPLMKIIASFFFLENCYTWVCG